MGFRVLADPFNDLGDGKTWVLECEPTDNLPKDADPVDLARQCLESKGIATETEGVRLKGQMLYVALSPPAQRTTQDQVQPGSPESDRESLRAERLRETYGVNLAGPPLPSYGTVTTKLIEAHNGERPSLEEVMGEGLKSARQSLGLKGGSPTVASSKSGKEGDDSEILAKRVAKKLANPAGNPTMTVEEVAHAFSKSKSAIYRWVDEGKKLGLIGKPLTWLDSAPGRISTELVRRILHG